MAPLGMNGRHRSLQDVFVDGKVPRERRDSWPVIVSEAGIVWLPGYRPDHSVCVVQTTRRVVELSACPPAGVRAMA